MVRKAKKIKRKTPSGNTVIRRGRKKPSIARCGNCGAKLHGIPKLRPSTIAKIASSNRKPNRPYGGSLCSRCMRETLKKKAV